MPVEAKPIFRPDVIRLPILGFALPEQVTKRRENLKKWSDIISSGSIDAHKRNRRSSATSLTTCSVSCWRTAAVDNPKRYTISREKHVAGQWQVCRRGARSSTARSWSSVLLPAAVRGKGRRTRSIARLGPELSAVDQAFDYAINLRCNWIVVTNIRQTRLYLWYPKLRKVPDVSRTAAGGKQPSKR